MKIIFLLIYSLLVLQSCSPNRIIIDKSKILIDERDSLVTIKLWPELKEHLPKIFRTKNYIHYEGKIESSFENTNFYLFRLSNIEPNSYIVTSSYSDTITIVPWDTTSWSYNDTVTVNFLNQRLKNEKPFNSHRVLRLFELYNKLSSPGYEFNIILDSWKNIRLKDGEIIPKEIKNLINSPMIEKINKGFIITAYIWGKGSTELYETKLYYSNNNIKIQTKFLGKFGEGIIIL